MTNAMLKRFDLSGKAAAVTGGGGDLCGHMAEALGAMGVKVAVLDINLEKAEARAQSVCRPEGRRGVSMRCPGCGPAPGLL